MAVFVDESERNCATLFVALFEISIGGMTPSAKTSFLSNRRTCVECEESVSILTAIKFYLAFSPSLFCGNRWRSRRLLPTRRALSPLPKPPPPAGAQTALAVAASRGKKCVRLRRGSSGVLAASPVTLTVLDWCFHGVFPASVKVFEILLTACVFLRNRKR